MSQRPDPLRKEQPEAEASGSGLRLMVAAVAGLTLVAGGGAWLRGATTDPAPAAQPLPQTAPAQPAATGQKGLQIAGQFALISPDHAAKALRNAGYSSNEQAQILAGIKRREYRLVSLPLFDAGGAGGVVSVQSGPVTRVVPLSQKPVSVVLPILVSGEVQVTPVSNPGVTGIEAGALTVLGPMVLPIIHNDEYLTMTVIAQ